MQNSSSVLKEPIDMEFSAWLSDIFVHMTQLIIMYVAHSSDRVIFHLIVNAIITKDEVVDLQINNDTEFIYSPVMC